MNAKKYECPSCGTAMIKDLDTWECEKCLFLDRETTVEAIEARALARIAEAIEKQNRAQRDALASGWRFEFSKARNEARWYSPAGESYIGPPCDERGKT